MTWVKFVFVGLLINGTAAFAGELNGVTMPESTTVAGKQLVLNGMGLRKKRVMGFPVKIYVAGFYLPKKNSDSKTILKSDEIAHLKMEFLRSVERKQLQDGWSEGFKGGCVKNCSAMKSDLRKFNQAMLEMRKGHKIEITFYADRVNVKVDALRKNDVDIQSADFSHNLLALFVGPKGSDRKLTQQLLGVK